MNAKHQESLWVERDYKGTRLDYYLVKRFPNQSRNHMQCLIAKGLIRLNKKTVRKQKRVTEGDVIDIVWPDETLPLVADNSIELSILYEDDDILVINKQAGLVVHPGAGNHDNTLVNALIAYDYARFSAMMDPQLRPGIVHRLDKGTSGVMVIAKNDSARLRLISSFKTNRVKKTYLSLVYGTPIKPCGRISSLIGRNPWNRKKMAVVSAKGKAAETRYKVLESQGEYSLLKINIHSGRTHQIRVHLESIGNPVIGDPVYCKKKHKLFTPSRQMLHAWRLGFPHPTTARNFQFIAMPPYDFSSMARRVGINVSFLYQ